MILQIVATLVPALLVVVCWNRRPRGLEGNKSAPALKLLAVAMPVHLLFVLGSVGFML